MGIDLEGLVQIAERPLTITLLAEYGTPPDS
jgi:hypothetical protein